MTASDPYSVTGDAEVVFETPTSHGHFFGYYDKSPFDRTGERLLCHRVGFDGRSIQAGDIAEVGYWNLDEEKFIKIGETRAFNWQQGSMLQWLPPEYDRRVIYNDLGDNSFRSVIVDVETGGEFELPNPIYAIHPSGEFALTVNFERMAYCRSGYSYKGVNQPGWDVPVHEDDGLFRVDLETGEARRVVGTRDVCRISPRPEFESRDNWLEHVMWNPAGTRFAFFHRWSDGRGRFMTRLFTADPDGSNLSLFPDTGLYSHLDWRSNEVLTVWGITPSSYQRTERFIRDNVLLDAVIRPIYGLLKEYVVGSRMDDVLPQRAFVQFHDGSDEFEVLAPDLLTEDGHITWTKDGRWLLTDTYPDDAGDQRLLIYDDTMGMVYELGRFYSHTAETPHKCDLHPRWDREEERIAIDSAHQPKRQMMVLEQRVT